MIDRKEGEFWIGRTEFDSPEVDNEVLISIEEKIKIGNFYQVKITDAAEFDLYGEIKKRGQLNILFLYSTTHVFYFFSFNSETLLMTYKYSSLIVSACLLFAKNAFSFNVTPLNLSITYFPFSFLYFKTLLSVI